MNGALAACWSVLGAYGLLRLIDDGWPLRRRRRRLSTPRPAAPAGEQPSPPAALTGWELTQLDRLLEQAPAGSPVRDNGRELADHLRRASAECDLVIARCLLAVLVYVLAIDEECTGAGLAENRFAVAATAIGTAALELTEAERAYGDAG